MASHMINWLRVRCRWWWFCPASLLRERAIEWALLVYLVWVSQKCRQREKWKFLLLLSITFIDFVYSWYCSTFFSEHVMISWKNQRYPLFTFSRFWSLQHVLVEEYPLQVDWCTRTWHVLRVELKWTFGLLSNWCRLCLMIILSPCIDMREGHDASDIWATNRKRLMREKWNV